MYCGPAVALYSYPTTLLPYNIGEVVNRKCCLWGGVGLHQFLQSVHDSFFFFQVRLAYFSLRFYCNPTSTIPTRMYVHTLDHGNLSIRVEMQLPYLHVFTHIIRMYIGVANVRSRCSCSFLDILDNIWTGFYDFLHIFSKNSKRLFLLYVCM